MVRFATEQITMSPMAQWAERIEAEYVDAGWRRRVMTAPS